MVASQAETVQRRLPTRRRLSELLGYRELLSNLIRKELKVKYKNSALGFIWSLLNPLLYLAIFSIVLGVFLRSNIPSFQFYLLSGLLSWNLLSASLSSATTSIVANGNLVTKVYFPREILPLSSVGAAMVHFLLQFGVLVGVMSIVGYWRHWDGGWGLLPLALIAELGLVAGMGLLLASANVYARDVQHLLELGLLAWFWMTPIVYASAWVAERIGRPLLWAIYLSNPMTPVVLGFQRALYSQVAPRGADGNPVQVLVAQPLGWYYKRLGYDLLIVAVFVVLAGIVFRRLEGRLAEEL